MGLIWVLIFNLYLYSNKTCKPAKLGGYGYRCDFSILDGYGTGIGVDFQSGYGCGFDITRPIVIPTNAIFI